MASRFVSGGTIAGDSGTAALDREKAAEGGSAQDSRGDLVGGGRERIGWDTEQRVGVGAGAGDKSTTMVEWEAVQRDLEEERRRRVDARRVAVEGGEKSLYEVLQANKAAKQAAFEEQNRIRNQFRALDDDEIEFLHGVSDDKHAEEERIRRETEEGLASFRKAQQAVGGGSGSAAGPDENPDAGGQDVGVEEWGAAAGRKRKREKEKAGLKGVRRRTSMPEEDKKESAKETGEGKKSGNKLSPIENTSKTGIAISPMKSTPTPSESAARNAASTPASAQTVTKPKPGLGLVDYGSDDDDDD
ncbi:hypothetical protein ONZ43_g7434 [Nemania bipapillata]|uniref:Uncharacterized protein n=1 Tax=Nemania bipapillata TaxID=110536 RepID=A0ACC2HRN3_9PEZI|nr:hypothetical protein ONZ43_g7434 [Nemania bipapillata]